MNDQRLAVLILSAVGMASVFMPWVKIQGLGYLLGMNYGGWICFILFLLVFLVAVLGKSNARLSQIKLYALIVLSLLAAGIGIWKITGVDYPQIFVEYGLYLMTLLGLVIPMAAFIMSKGKSRTTISRGASQFSFDTGTTKKGAPD